MPAFALGETVTVHGQPATVKYCGATSFADGEWVGVAFGTRTGKNDGTVKGVRYFTCEPGHGLFVHPSGVRRSGGVSLPALSNAEAASAWAAVEEINETRALEASQQGEKLIAHLSKLHPELSQKAIERESQGADAAAVLAKGRNSKGFKGKKPATGMLRPAGLNKRLSAAGDDAYAMIVETTEVPSNYRGPMLSDPPTASEADALVAHVKRHVASGQAGPAVPLKLALRVLLRAKQRLGRDVGDDAVVDVNFSRGRVVVVGDTHGQLADWLWILRSHGPPNGENVYVINGDVADRGRHAVEIFLLIFSYMLACPGSVVLNRGNHESIDMNARSFREGGGFAQEVGAKYDSNTFTLFQEIFNLLPLAVRVNSEVLVVHGGLCRTAAATLDQLRKVQRVRPVPVSTADKRDTLFFDTMWADPQPLDGVGLSAARGAGCVTFGPDITRKFCEMNRLRMVIRSHEVPKTMTGVHVQHDGRLVTVFSASNYCGRIGNTGGTMLLSPQLEYQLMEHWAPTVAELLAMEEAERVEEAEEPSVRRSQFSQEADSLMSDDILVKMKELVAEHKRRLLLHYETKDRGDGCVSIDAWLGGLRAIVGDFLPWEQMIDDLVVTEADGSVKYRPFLSRYRVSHNDDGWQARLLSKLYSELAAKDLTGTLSFFDVNKDGVVTMDELLGVLRRFNFGIAEHSLDQLASRMLRGQPSMRTAELIDAFALEYRDLHGERTPPDWAAPLLQSVSRQCTVRPRDTVDLFRSFDTDGNGYISYDEFTKAMLTLGGGGGAGKPQDAAAKERMATMLADLAKWVDHDQSGSINYLEFCAAFRVADGGAEKATGQGGGGMREIVDSLLHLFFQHRFSLKRAFEFFDVNGDGVLSPDEFRAAVRDLSTLETDDGAVPLGLTAEQTDNLVASLDTDGDGFIDYEEFLQALSPSDAMER